MVRFGIYFVPLQAKKKKTMAIEDAIFRRSELLLGEEAMERIARKRVIIFGVGGVGSWCAESLVRSGIRRKKSSSQSTSSSVYIATNCWRIWDITLPVAQSSACVRKQKMVQATPVSWTMNGVHRKPKSTVPLPISLPSSALRSLD